MNLIKRNIGHTTAITNINSQKDLMYTIVKINIAMGATIQKMIKKQSPKKEDNVSLFLIIFITIKLLTFLFQYHYTKAE